MNNLLKQEKLLSKQPKTLANSFAFIPSIGNERTRFKRLPAAIKSAKKIKNNYIGNDIVIYKHLNEFVIGWDMPGAIDYNDEFICHID
jgi:hypothetical protein